MLGPETVAGVDRYKEDLDECQEGLLHMIRVAEGIEKDCPVVSCNMVRVYVKCSLKSYHGVLHNLLQHSCFVGENV